MSIIGSNGGFVSTLLAGTGTVEHLFGTAAWRPEGPLLRLRQVHSARIIDASEWREDLEADGVVTNRPGLRLSIRTADCVPLLLCDPAAPAIAAIHAGWRGAAAGIGREAVGFLQARYGSDPRRLVAALGPAIGGCCYEVGPEVAHLFRTLFPERNDLDARTRIDLREALRRQLLAAGLDPARIDVSPHCTRCGGSQFYSYRRDGARAGRMISFIALQPGREGSNPYRAG